MRVFPRLNSFLVFTVLLLAGAACRTTPVPERRQSLHGRGVRNSATLSRWRALQPGVHYATVSAQYAAEVMHDVRDQRLHILRVDPRRARLVALLASQANKEPRTAGQWADEHALVAAINLGMYERDRRTHTGYLRSGDHINNDRWVAAYQSALAFDPKLPGLPQAALLDLDAGRGAHEKVVQRYTVVTQNLRLIKRAEGGQGQGVWSRQDKRWSEAALAIDRDGRLLLLFTRVPLTMWEFNRFVLSLPLGVVRAMHMDGGPPASLSIRGKGLKLDVCGSFESGVFPSDANAEQWALPNVLGVIRQQPGGAGQ
jgi:hypothetical protein